MSKRKDKIPDTIYRAEIDGAEVTAIYHSDAWRTGIERPLEVSGGTPDLRNNILAGWDREWEIDEEEIAAGRRSQFSTPEGILYWMLVEMAGGEDAVKVVQEPELSDYGVIL